MVAYTPMVKRMALKSALCFHAFGTGTLLKLVHYFIYNQHFGNSTFKWICWDLLWIMSCIFHVIDLVKLSCPGMEYAPPPSAHEILFIMWSTMTCATDILKSIFLKADTFGQIKYNVGNNNKPTHLGMVLYHLFMVIWGMVYYCFTHITVGRIFVRQRLAWHGVQGPGKQWLFPKTCVPWCLDCVSYRYGHIYVYI